MEWWDNYLPDIDSNYIPKSGFRTMDQKISTQDKFVNAFPAIALAILAGAGLIVAFVL